LNKLICFVGVKTIWFSPFYKSPFKDLGYDISDFCSIDPHFRNFDDFKLSLDDIKISAFKTVPLFCALENSLLMFDKKKNGNKVHTIITYVLST